MKWRNDPIDILALLEEDPSESELEELELYARGDAEFAKDFAAAKRVVALTRQVRESRHHVSPGFSDRIMKEIERKDRTRAEEPNGVRGAWTERITNMLSPRSVALSLAASFCFMICSIGFRVLEAPKLVYLPGVQVLIPVTDIPRGTKLTAALFRREFRYSGELPPGAIAEVNTLEGKFARQLLIANHPFNNQFITSPRSTDILLAALPAGKRAVTIGINFNSSSDFPITNGEEVDVMWGAVQGDSTAFTPHALLSTKAKVLTVNSADAIPDGFTHFVTVEVPEEEAAKIDLGQAAGEVALLARQLPMVRQRISDFSPLREL